MNKLLIFALISFSLLMLSFTNIYAEAQVPKANNTEARNSSNIVAIVNGFDIQKDTIDGLVAIAVKQGSQDNPALRNQILDAYINNILLSQESLKLGLDKTADAKARLATLKTNFLANLAMSEYLSKKLINDASLKTEYDLQVASLNKNSDLQQYKISIILLKSDEEAKDILMKIKKGDSFNQLAKDFSIEKGKNGDGTSDWLLPNQIIPDLSNVIVNLSKGAYSAVPIRTQRGVYLVKLDDKRPYKIPSFDESKTNLQAQLVQKYQFEYISKLKKESKIQIR